MLDKNNIDRLRAQWVAITLLSASLLGSCSGAGDVQQSNSWEHQSSQALKRDDIAHIYGVCSRIVSLGQIGETMETRKTIDTLTEKLKAVESNVLAIDLLVDAEKRVRQIDREDSASESYKLSRVCDYAIYKCAWSIANSEEKGAGDALVYVKKKWSPDGMNGLLFHRCELRQQHRPDDWL